jgi:hypothetical protein
VKDAPPLPSCRFLRIEVHEKPSSPPGFVVVEGGTWVVPREAELGRFRGRRLGRAGEEELRWNCGPWEAKLK